MQSVVQSAATPVLAAPSTGFPRTVILQNRTAGDVWIGSATVTADNTVTGGFKIIGGDSFGFVVAPGQAVYVVGTAGPVSVLDVTAQ